MLKKYSQLTPLKDDIYLYKYLSFDRFGQILSDNFLRFNRADQLIEYHKGILSPAERKFLHNKYLANEEENNGRKLFNRNVSTFKRLCRQTYLCCWSTSINEQLLNKYLPDGNGIVIRVFSKNLVDEINTSLEFRKPEIFKINYVDFEEDVNEIPEGLVIFGRKRIDQDFESEARIAFMTESKKTNPETINIAINSNLLIDELIVPPNLSFEYQLKFLQLIEEYNMHDKAANVIFYDSNYENTKKHKIHSEIGLIANLK